MRLFRRRAKLAGHLDRLDHTVAGWVLDTSDPQRTVGITLVQDGEVLHNWNAMIFRPDVASKYGSSGHHGFSVDLHKVQGVRAGALVEVFADGPLGVRLGAGRFRPAARAARGDDGWLFLQNDSNDVNARISGARKYDVSRCVALYEQRAMRFRTTGIPWLPLVIPEKNVVCQHLWRAHVISESRPARVIEAQLRDRGVDPGYMIDVALETGNEFFLRTDTHPSGRGHLAVMRALATRCPRFFRDIPLPQLTLVRDFIGDLGVGFDPPVTETASRHAIPASEGPCLVVDTVNAAFSARSTLRGNVAVMRNDAAPHRRLLLFGTSTAFRLMHYLAHAFRDVVFVWENTLDHPLITTLSPDLVMWVAAERFLPIVCDDTTGVPAARERLSGWKPAGS